MCTLLLVLLLNIKPHHGASFSLNTDTIPGRLLIGIQDGRSFSGGSLDPVVYWDMEDNLIQCVHSCFDNRVLVEPSSRRTVHGPLIIFRVLAFYQ